MIIGDKIILRNITDEHTALILKWRNNSKVSDNFIFREKLTEEMHNRWLENKVKKGNVLQFIIYIKNENIPIGSVYLRDIDNMNDKAEFGIFIGESLHRGKGYGTEATKLICQYGFDKLNLNKIMLRVFAFNQKAINVYQQVGFKKEAYLKKEVKINNQYEDIIFMAKFKSEN